MVAAFAAKPGAGTVGIDGMMYDRPHLVRAQALLARAKGLVALALGEGRQHALRLVGFEGAHEGVDAGCDRARRPAAFSHSRISAFWLRTACGAGRQAAPRTIVSTSRSSASGATTRSTRPQRSAVSASMISPSINSSRARPKPISRGMSAASTTDGMPTLTSGMPNLARVVATRRSQDTATSSPAPSA